MYVNFDQIIDDYKKIINTNHVIPINDGTTIEFTFQGSHLPHLLGLNKLVDIPILQRYANKLDKIIGGEYIWKGICDKSIDTSEFCYSIHYEDIYEDKLKHFDLDILMKPMKIIKFDSKKVNDFIPKIEKVLYIFWDYFKETGKHGHFGIGFELRVNKHFPNTFFYRSNNDYISGQEEVLPYSYFIKHQDGRIDFVVYWENVRDSLKKTAHYKYLKQHEDIVGIEVAKMTKDMVDKSDDEEIKRHFRLMRLDEVKKAYLPYLNGADTWNNKTKTFLVEKIDLHTGDYRPFEIKSLLNEVPQKKESVPGKMNK